MERRSILENGRTIELYANTKTGRQAKQFHITRLVSEIGASTIVYRAYHENSSNLGILREFYPKEMHDIVLDREKDGMLRLDMSPDSEAERSAFLISKSRYLEPYSMLSDMRMHIKNDTLDFIPHFEIYYGSGNIEQDDGTVYIWTPETQRETFSDICDEIHRNPEKEPEYYLYIVLNGIYSLAQCIEELHEEGFIHRDIKPDNFGFDTRDGEVLTQSISLFDIDSICKAYPPPTEDVGTPGFREPDDERKIDNLTDIYSIGATLFYAIIVNDRTKENGYKYQECYYDEINELVKTSRLIQASEGNSFPRLRSYLAKILKKCLCSRYSREETRYEDCRALADDLRAALRYVYPLEITRGYATGEKWIFRDVKKWFDSREEKNSRLALQYHLYKYPLYKFLAPEKDLNILIVGFGRYGFKFLDLALQAAQNLDHNVKVTIVSSSVDRDDITDEELYLEERPEFTKFFSVSGKEAVAWAYGEVKFICARLIDDQDELKINSASLRSIMEQLTTPEYVFIDMNNDMLNKETARVISAEGCTGLINYVHEGYFSGEPNEKEGIYPVKASVDVCKLPDFKEIERMAFNAHLVWNENNDISFEVKKKEFMEEYNYDSSISNVLAIKYKLWTVGIDLEEEDFHTAANKFDVLLKQDEQKRQYLTWLEHRRWVTEKICDGWIGRTPEECIPLSETVDDVTREKKNKVHVCIVKSNPEWKLNNVDTKLWDSGGLDTSGLDELDSLSIGLHRFYEQQASNMALGDFNIERSQLMDSSAFTCFEEWIEAKENLLKSGNRESASAFKALWIRLKDAIYKDDSGRITSSQKKRIVEGIENNIKPILNRYEYKDYKKIDVDLVDRIPYILTYDEKMEIVCPVKAFGKDSSKDSSEDISELPIEYIFRHVAAVSFLNPCKVHYLYYVPDESGISALKNFSKLNNLMQRLIAYKNRKELGCRINLVVFYRSNTTGSFFDLSGQTGGEYEVEKKEIKSRSDASVAAENYVQELCKDKNILLEENETLSDGWLSGSKIGSMLPSFIFDGTGMNFTKMNGCEWLDYIKGKHSLDIRDIAALSGREFSFDEKLDFGLRENRNIWKMYKEDSSRWKTCSKILSRKNNHLVEIMSCSISEANGEQIGTHKFFMRGDCFSSLQMCADHLINAGIILKESYVCMCSSTVCCLVAKCNDKMKGIIDKMLSNDYAFRDSEELEFFIYENEQSFSVGYNGLKVVGIALRDRLEELVVKNQLSGKHEAITKAENEITTLLRKFYGKGLIHNLTIKKGKVSFTYGSQTIKKLMSQGGNILELKVYQDLLDMNITKSGEGQCFDDIVGGVTFKIEGEDSEQIDCLVIKGFRSLVIECKAQDGLTKKEIKGYVEKLEDRVRKFGIYSKGLLLIDSNEPLKGSQGNDLVIVKRVDDITNNNDNNKNMIAEYIYEILTK